MRNSSPTSRVVRRILISVCFALFACESDPPNPEANCSNGQIDPGETDLDCGGSCERKCRAGEGCASGDDCQTGFCRVGSNSVGVCEPFVTCDDALRNGAETDIDCGGSACPKCQDGFFCQGAEDCQSGLCVTGPSGAATCEPAASCDDDTVNGNETDTDCGGTSCPRCLEGALCALPSDCESGGCEASPSGERRCVVPDTCGDGVQSGAETDRDCGGSRCPPCREGARCATNSDCTSGVCRADGAGVWMCQKPGCDDGVRNMAETGTDCGGPSCEPCPLDQGCRTNDDCWGRDCRIDGEGNATCAAPASCFDRESNGLETGVDCGGPACPPCGPMGFCRSAADCTTRLCALGYYGGQCVSMPDCGNGVFEWGETSMDCGGFCGPCDNGEGCRRGSDCVSGVCLGSYHLTCFDPIDTCMNGLQDGEERGVDCGGQCAGCSDGSQCFNHSDCASGHCTAAQLCGQLPSCTDGARSETLGETDIDCGGYYCERCESRRECRIDTDCLSGECTRLEFESAATCKRPARCDDGQKNGAETDVDCGGPDCAPCGAGKGCLAAADCITPFCVPGPAPTRALVCTTTTCDDGLQDRDEEGVDCGGAFCGRCPGQACGVSSDCAAVPGAQARCEVGFCSLVCRAGFDDCDADPTTGCEAHLATDKAHCGECGQGCEVACVDGGCVDVVEVAGSRSNTCALLADGNVRCFGGNDSWQSGQLIQTTILPALAIAVPPSASALARGNLGAHHCLLDTDGGVWCWGENHDGQLGDGSFESNPTPQRVLQNGGGSNHLEDVATVARGWHHTCAVRRNGTMACWGRGWTGALGNGSTATETQATDVPGITDAVRVAANASGTCITHAFGRVSCWGSLPGPGYASSPTPVYINGFSARAIDVALTPSTACALLDTGRIECWGDNLYGELGADLAANVNTTTPQAVAAISDALALAATGYAYLALTSDGRVHVWGRVDFKLAGVDGPIEQRVPIAVAGIAGATRIFPGGLHACALIGATGPTTCWGYNQNSQVGLPGLGFLDSRAPTPVLW